jgi:hypothetical protein
VQLDALILLAVPTPGPHAGICRRDVARLGQQQSHGVLGSTDGVGLGSIDHQDAGGGGGLQIDVVDPDAGPTDHPQPGCSFNQFRVDRSGGPHYQTLGIGEPAQQIMTRNSTRVVDVIRLRQGVDALLRNRLGYHDLGPHGFFLPGTAILPDRAATTKPAAG